MATKTRVAWGPVLEHAAAVVESYDTAVTLRQLFYRLVSAELLPNTQSAYSTLSSRTAAARREGWFPALIDRTRSIHEYRTFTDPQSARKWLAKIYRRDRTEGQDWTVYLGVEKHGIVNQLQSWFGRLGVPIVSLGGYASQSYVDEITEHAESQGRPAVLIYAGDFDPSGHDIERDFVSRTNCFTDALRIALTQEQIDEYRLPPLPGKASDTRAAGFVDKYGALMQVELDALPPDTLRELYQDAIDGYIDMSTFEQVMDREAEERRKLTATESE